MKLCGKCKRLKDEKEFYFRTSRCLYESPCLQCRAGTSRDYYLKNKDRVEEKQREWYHDVRRRAIKELGGPACINCGFDNVDALQIDHVHGGGYLERGKYAMSTIYRRIADGEVNLDDYQILCANCNTIKGAAK